MSDDNPFAAPKSLDTAPVVPARVDRFYPVAIPKFLLLGVLTWGLYPTYWFWRQWRTIRACLGQSLSPFWRTVFSLFYVHSLADEVETAIILYQKPYSWRPSLIATGVVLLWVATAVLVGIGNSFHWDRLLIYGLSYLLSWGSLWLFLLMQRAMNYANGDPSGSANSRITIWNLLWILLGTVNLLSPWLLDGLVMTLSLANGS